MKKLGATLILLLSFFSLVVFAAGGIKEFSQDILRFGSSGAGVRSIIFDASPDGTSGTISVDPSTDQFTMNNKLNLGADLTMLGDNFTLGDGTNTDKSIIFSNGAANPPKLVYNATDSAWTFTNDGTLFKKIGSGSGAGSGGINILANAGFEDGADRNWNTSANIAVSSISSGADLGIGEKSSKLVASGAGTYCSDLQTKPNALGFGCQVSFKYKGGSTDHHKLIIYDNTGTPNKLTEFDIVHSDVWYEVNTSAIKSFACAAEMKLCIETDQADATGNENIVLDEMYLGNNKNFTSIQPSAQFLGSIAWQKTTDLLWDSTSSTYASFSDDLEGDDNPRILKGNAVDSSLGLRPEVKFNYFKKGHYKIIISGSIYKNTTASSTRFIRISDGTNNSNELEISPSYSASGMISTSVVEVDYLSDAQNVVLSLQAKTDDTIAVDVRFSYFQISVYYYPDKGFEAYYPEQSTFFYRGYITGTSKDVTNKSRTVQPVEQSDFVLTNVIGSGKIPCDNSGVDSTGTTCATGDENLGIALDIPTSGKYRVCFNSTLEITSSNAYFTYRIAETENDNPVNITVSDKFNAGYNSNGAYIDTQLNLCDDFEISDVGKHTFRLVLTNNTAGHSYVYSNSDYHFNITVERILENVHAPFILNQVSTSVDSGIEVNSCSFLNNGTVTMATDDCDAWISSATRTSTGTIQIAMKKNLGSKTTCTCAVGTWGGNGFACGTRTKAFESSYNEDRVELVVTNGSASDDENVSIECKTKR